MIFANLLNYYLTHQAEFWGRLLVHLQLSGTALLVGGLLGLMGGMLASRSRLAARWVTSSFGALRAVPSLAVMAVMLPWLGVGFLPAMVALSLLALPPVLINTVAGLRAVNPAVVEAARGMGLSRGQVARQVQLPLALPVVLAGIRTAAVEVTASATIGALIGAGGLGEYVFAGLSLGPRYLHIMLLGAVTIALLAILIELSFETLLRITRRVE